MANDGRPGIEGGARISSPRALREKAIELRRDQQRDQRDLAGVEARLATVRAFLETAPKVETALDKLSQELFRGMVAVLEEKLTIALQEVIEQPIKFKAVPSFRRGTINLDFEIERGAEQTEDVLRGQGGSVTNVLSVGLRMFALTSLDESQHRRFLILDEQDCWLRPDLVPKLVQIVHEAGRALGFQVLMISHHDISTFERFAEKIYQCTLTEDGAKLTAIDMRPTESDPD